MKIAFNPSTVAALIAPPNNKDITFDLRGHNIFARGVKFCGTDTNTWRDIKINNVSIDSNILDLRDGDNTTLTNINGVVTINSTWRPVVDNLTSDSTTSSLSANQGRVLKALIDGKSDSDHNHDDRYVKKSGDTMLGALNFANGTWNLVGDDSYMGDCNISGHFGIKAANTTYPGIAFFNNANAHLGNLTAYNGNIKYGAYSLQFLDNGNTSVSASTWMNPFSDYNSNAVADGQAICVWGQSSSLSNLAADSGDMSLWLKRVNANVATLNMVLDGEYYANGNQRLAHVSEIPTSLKNPHALTISLNGTSQGPYDGSAAKNINITPSSIGAATSDHNHINYLSANGLISGNIDNIWTHGTYGFGNRSSYTGALPGNSSYGGFLVLNPNATTTGAYYTTQIALLPGYFGYRIYDDNKWYDWKEVSMVGHNHDGRYVRYYAVTTLDCNNLAVGLTAAGVSATNAAHTNHSAFLYISDVGTPFQLQIPDSSVPYIYKRCYSSGTWSGWFKLNAGYADSAGSATKLQTPRSIWGQSFDGTGNVDNTLRIRQTTSNWCEGIRIQNGDNTWATIILGATSDYGTNDNAWSIHRKDDNNFAISRNSSDGLNGLVMTSVGMGLGTTAPYMRLHVNGDGIYLNSTATCGINMYSSHGESSISYKSIDGIRTVLGTYTNRTFLWNESIGEHVSILSSNGYFGIGTTNPYYKLDVNGDIWCRGALRVGSSATNNYIAFYGNTGDAPGSFVTSFIGEHLWGGDESTELLLMKFNDVGNGTDGITPYGPGPDRIRHIAHAHVFQIMTDSSQGDFATMAATTAVETKLDITRNRITASVPLYLQSDLHVNGTLGVNNIATFNINNQWLTPSVLQIGRLDTSQNESKAVIGVTDGNLHIDAYHGKQLYLNYYNRGEIRLGYQTGSYYISQDGSYYSGTVASASNADMLDGYHENSFLRCRGHTNTDQEATLWNQIGIKEYYGALPDGLTDIYNWGGVISLSGTYSRFEIYASHLSSAGNGLYYRSGWDSDKKSWLKFIDSSNIGSQSVNYANSAGNADTTDGVHITWAGELTSTNHLVAWEADGSALRDINPANISVGYASSAGNADMVDGYHASGLWRSDGGIWNPGANISLTASGNNQEWSFDIRRNGYTGCYWHVWDSALSTLLKVNADNGKVYAPYNFVGNLEGNASTATYATNANNASVASKVYGQVGDTGSHELVRCDMNNDQFRIIAGSNGNNNGWAEIATADDGNEPIYVRQYTGVFSSVVRTLTLLDANGYTHFPSYINIGGNENNNSSPDRVWGSNSSDSYLRSYRTSALNVNYAASAGNADTVDGYHATSFLKDMGGGNWNFNFNDGFNSGIYYVHDQYTQLNAPSTYGLILDASTDAGHLQLASDSGNKYYIRGCWWTGGGGTWDSWRTIIHSGNIGSQSVNYANSAGNAETLGGMPKNYGQAPFNTIPYVGGNGVMEIGRYIDYHYDNSGNYDFSTRLQTSGNNRNVVTLPSASGTLALTSYGGDYDHPIFLGCFDLNHGNDGTISSSFYCLGYSVPFTYTRGGNYCRISIPDTTHQVFYIKAAIASVNYSGGGMDTWVGDHRNAGAWWLHCYASGSNEVRVKGFCQRNSNNDSWWGGNPLWSDSSGANRITVCIFGYVTFR